MRALLIFVILVKYSGLHGVNKVIKTVKMLTERKYGYNISPMFYWVISSIGRAADS